MRLGRLLLVQWRTLEIQQQRDKYSRYQQWPQKLLQAQVVTFCQILNIKFLQFIITYIIAHYSIQSIRLQYIPINKLIINFDSQILIKNILPTNVLRQKQFPNKFGDKETYSEKIRKIIKLQIGVLSVKLLIIKPSLHKPNSNIINQIKRKWLHLFRHN
ncbi:hypothetical protein FGO68_gene7370 [Halteria grandinella]|uniref:Uncharacterized protein n=1 Tax=Halteria grandinella TaxID=5974 RepID=A0A8J8NFE3_HALGN|nr:hypothetical protein FGO68_gene7370 [Halteria grandinella]